MVRAACLILALLSGPAFAQDTPNAIGRVRYGAILQPGAGICTGALIAPDLVLTAAHCVRGAEADASRLRFDFAWGPQRPGAQGRGAQVMVMQGPVLPSIGAFVQDVALIRLIDPVSARVATPLALAPPEAVDDVFHLIAFRRDAPNFPSDRAPCRMTARLLVFLGFDCAVVSGNSGAPVLTQSGQVAGVFVASSGGQVRSWAVQLPAWVRTQLAANVSRAKQ